MTSDIRMRGFARRHTVDAALAVLDAHLQSLDAESVALREATGRVLADDVVSGVDVPGFDRATMDGYAVVAASTEGAASYTPIQRNGSTGSRVLRAWAPSAQSHRERTSAAVAKTSPGERRFSSAGALCVHRISAW